MAMSGLAIAFFGWTALIVAGAGNRGTSTAERKADAELADNPLAAIALGATGAKTAFLEAALAVGSFETKRSGATIFVNDAGLACFGPDRKVGATTGLARETWGALIIFLTAIQRDVGGTDRPAVVSLDPLENRP